MSERKKTDTVEPDNAGVLPDSVASKRKERDSPLPPDHDTNNTDEESQRNKRVKTENSPERAVKKEEESEEEQLPKRVMVEFMFRSYPTHLFHEGDLKGTMHIPMDQDPVTGLHSIPGGTTRFQAKLDADSVNWSEYEDSRNFSGYFTRGQNGGRIGMEPGLTLDYHAFEDREVHASARPSDGYTDFPDEAKWALSSDFGSRGDLDKWEKEQGGILEFEADAAISWIEEDGSASELEDEYYGYGYGSDNPNYRRAEATYKIKLYTVLSAHKPNEAENALPKYKPGDLPDWAALVCIVAARHPEKGSEAEPWAKRAVEQYKHWLDLKLDKDLAKSKFSPSKAVDEIWHAHLSFVDRYQKDLICLTKGESIVEHMPVYIKESYRCYTEAHKEHSKRMAKSGTAVDEEFWPTPARSLFPDTGRGHGDFDYIDAGANAGCGGCG